MNRAFGARKHQGNGPVAIFSLNHSTVGRKTHAPRTAGFHVRYITRPQAATRILGERMPLDPFAARAWIDSQEKGDRINARVVDKLIVALPLELTHEQRVGLVQQYAEAMTEGRASWMAALHDGINDLDNPHAHILFRDRDANGKRVMQLSEKGSTERLRIAWEEHTNVALERAGRPERVDRRTLEAQGIDREAGIHIGPAAQVLDTRGERPKSKTHEIVHIINGERTPITVDYPSIDAGRTRIEENQERRNRNQARFHTEPEPDWTHRGGMAAQQRSALDWARIANDNPANSAAAVAPGTTSPGPGGASEQGKGEARPGPTETRPRKWEIKLSDAARAQLEASGRDDKDIDHDLGR